MATSGAGRRIERLLADEKWSEARREIEKALLGAPDHHWLLSRLALTHYEQRRYAKALALERKALRIAPHCPLTLWGLGGSLEMLGRRSEAERVYRRLLRRGARRLARGPCGEGLQWARGLVADCWYRIGGIRAKRGDRTGARAAYTRYLLFRSSGGSIYSRQEALERLRRLTCPRFLDHRQVEDPATVFPVTCPRFLDHRQVEDPATVFPVSVLTVRANSSGVRFPIEECGLFWL